MSCQICNHTFLVNHDPLVWSFGGINCNNYISNVVSKYAIHLIENRCIICRSKVEDLSHEVLSLVQPYLATKLASVYPLALFAVHDSTQSQLHWTQKGCWLFV